MVVVGQFAMLTELDGLALHDERDQFGVDVTVNEEAVAQTAELHFIEVVICKHSALEMRAAFGFDRANHRLPSPACGLLSERVSREFRNPMSVIAFIGTSRGSLSLVAGGGLMQVNCAKCGRPIA